MSLAYRTHTDADARLRSALTAAEAISHLDLYPAHKRELLSVCIWKVTEAAPMSKYQTRYRSRGSLAAPESDLAHDHVYQRKRLIDAMLADPDDASRILLSAVACVVTHEEHFRLTAISREAKDLDGWDRYERAGIEVVEMESESPP